ncbi:MAG TPA: ABC transporter ATP-binding protein [candidate division Zixibacteria bacterium]|nr:ABC transporter ATP-binding protein [candidate division Zixibacteria bacterium]
MSKIVVESLCRSFGELRVLEDVSLAVEEGELLAIVGPSGCGKSTLLRILSGLVRPTAGRVLIDSAEVTGPNPRHNMVFQEHALYPWRTVFQNVALGLEIQKRDRDAIRRKVASLLGMVGLENFASYYPHQLSGGMRQRVSLARAIAVDPDVLFLDEPFGALDAMTRLTLQDELLRLWLDATKTTILVTHDVEEALFLADRVVVMSALPGRVREVIVVPEKRPRDRGSASLARLKRGILHLLGLESRVRRAAAPDFSI